MTGIVRHVLVGSGAENRPKRAGLSRIVLVPGTLALLPEYASAVDPVAGLRAACVEAVRWLEGPVTVLADAQGSRVAAALLAAAGVSDEVPAGAGPEGGACLVVGNGSACRSEKAPGHLVDGARDFDDALGAALRAGDLAAVDLSAADRVWARLGAIPELVGLLDGTPAQVDYDDDPYGVQYWVMRWERRP